MYAIAKPDTRTTVRRPSPHVIEGKVYTNVKPTTNGHFIQVEDKMIAFAPSTGRGSVGWLWKVYQGDPPKATETKPNKFVEVEEHLIHLQKLLAEMHEVITYIRARI